MWIVEWDENRYLFYFIEMGTVDESSGVKIVALLKDGTE